MPGDPSSWGPRSASCRKGGWTQLGHRARSLFQHFPACHGLLPAPRCPLVSALWLGGQLERGWMGDPASHLSSHSQTVGAGRVPCSSPGGPTGQSWQLPVGWPQTPAGCQHPQVLAALLTGVLPQIPVCWGPPRGPCSNTGLSQGPHGLVNLCACPLQGRIVLF